MNIQTDVHHNDLAVFCRHVHLLLEAGMSASQALASAANRVDDPAVAAAGIRVSVRVRSGIPVGQAMRENPGVFPEPLCEAISSAEASGTLTAVAAGLADMYDAK